MADAATPTAEPPKTTDLILPETLPPWAKEALRIGLTLLIAFLAAKYGVIVPTPATPTPIVVQTTPTACTCAK